MRIFHNWRWSWKKPAVQHIQKYTPENIQYYAEWVTFIPYIPLTSLKFVDEAHYVSRNLHRNLVLAPIGVQPYLRDGTDLADSFSLTLLTDLSEEADSPFYIDIRSYSNTEEDYLAFITAAIAAGRLQKGDYLIADNASIHFGAATRTQLQELLAENGVTYLFLPTYSPELNPCELVFAYCKHYIRTHRRPTDQVHNLLLTALVALPRNHVVAYYERCVYIQDRVVAQ